MTQNSCRRYASVGNQWNGTYGTIPLACRSAPWNVGNEGSTIILGAYLCFCQTKR